MKTVDEKGTKALRNTASTATLEMVAARAGVSPSTVSRVLNGTAVVSSVKRNAVGAAIAELGFVPNPVARGLAGGRTLSVGVVAPSIDSPFYGVVLRGIEEELSRAGYSPLIASSRFDATEEQHCIEVLRSRRVDGIILLDGGLSVRVLRAHAKVLPMVITGRHLKAPNLCGLHFDNIEGGRLATQHLIELGHRHIAFITGDARHPDANERLAGYCAALKEAGLELNPALVIPGLFHEASGLAAVERLLDSGERFSAIFAANDQMALGAALGLHRHSMRIPQDVSLVGYDDIAIALYSTPPLSTVRQSGYEVGQLAAAAMLKMVAGEKPLVKLPPPKFIARESTCAAVDA
jgi:LacI family transcriptional regulator